MYVTDGSDRTSSVPSSVLHLKVDMRIHITRKNSTHKGAFFIWEFGDIFTCTTLTSTHTQRQVSKRWMMLDVLFGMWHNFSGTYYVACTFWYLTYFNSIKNYSQKVQTRSFFNLDSSIPIIGQTQRKAWKKLFCQFFDAFGKIFWDLGWDSPRYIDRVW